MQPKVEAPETWNVILDPFISPDPPFKPIPYSFSLALYMLAYVSIIIFLMMQSTDPSPPR